MQRPCRSASNISSSTAVPATAAGGSFNVMPDCWPGGSPKRIKADRRLNKGFARAPRDPRLDQLRRRYLPNAISEAVAYLQSPPKQAWLRRRQSDRRHDAILGRFPARQTDYRRRGVALSHSSASRLFFARPVAEVGPAGPPVHLLPLVTPCGCAGAAQNSALPSACGQFRLPSRGPSFAGRCGPTLLRSTSAQAALLSWLVYKAKIAPCLFMVPLPIV